MKKEKYLKAVRLEKELIKYLKSNYKTFSMGVRDCIKKDMEKKTKA